MVSFSGSPEMTFSLDGCVLFAVGVFDLEDDTAGVFGFGVGSVTPVSSFSTDDSSSFSLGSAVIATVGFWADLPILGANFCLPGLSTVKELMTAAALLVLEEFIKNNITGGPWYGINVRTKSDQQVHPAGL